MNDCPKIPNGLISPHERKRIYRAQRKWRMDGSKEKGSHTKAQWIELCKEFDFRCVRCLCRPVKIFKDHIVPIYQGGSDCISNMQPVCPKCSSSKGPEDTNWVEIRRKGM